MSAESLLQFVRDHPRLLVLTGAGCSTESGIPDYRDRQGRWKVAAPILYQDFLTKASVRKRYWARSLIGWRRFAAARAAAAHRALAGLEAAGRIQQLVTQNVDGLHQQAGQQQLVELHGNLGRARCLDCGAYRCRRAIQYELERSNPAYAAASATLGPDGDADVKPSDLDDFCVPVCRDCGGTIKPDVVFFGESTAPRRVEQAMQALERADAMLVVGSSLMLRSGYRFCARAVDIGRPIAAVNLGTTRADPLFRIKVEAPCGDTLMRLAEALA